MSPELLRAAIGLVGGYLLGSIPSGLIVSRMAGAGDPRLAGSRNIGTTNVFRVGGPGVAGVTFVLDVLKGFGAVHLARTLGPSPLPGSFLAPESLHVTAALVAPVLGHCFPPWLGFRGGKGVATALGALLAAWWPGALAGLAIFVLVVAATRKVSLGSLAAAAALPVVLALAPVRELYLPAGVLLAVTVVGRHHENIRRLLAGSEHRLGEGDRRRKGPS